MSERRPRRRDFDTNGRYYFVLLIWLDWRYDDQVDRARKFHKFTQKENDMPVIRETKTVETAAQRASRFATEDLLERAGIGPRADAGQRKRNVESIELDCDLTPDEQAEFDSFVKRRNTRRQVAREFAAAVD